MTKKTQKKVEQFNIIASNIVLVIVIVYMGWYYGRLALCYLAKRKMKKIKNG